MQRSSAEIMTPTLLVLAAGVGSRFGAPKQLEPIGPAGATLVEYSIVDARRAGFNKIVLVIRREMQERFASLLERRLDVREVSFVAQDADPALEARAERLGRRKPWGTAHAVLAAADVIHSPFLVINADDFYGRTSYQCVSEWLRRERISVDDSTYGLVSFPLAATLSPSGGVNRALCEVTADGWLRSVREAIGIEREGSGGRYVDQRGVVHRLAATSPVSMNMWVFTPRIFPELADQFRLFLNAADHHSEAELLLPTAVNTLVAAGRARVRVLAGGQSWCGMTYRDDVEAVRRTIIELTASGGYEGL